LHLFLLSQGLYNVRDGKKSRKVDAMCLLKSANGIVLFEVTIYSDRIK